MSTYHASMSRHLGLPESVQPRWQLWGRSCHPTCGAGCPSVEFRGAHDMNGHCKQTGSIILETCIPAVDALMRAVPGLMERRHSTTEDGQGPTEAT